MNNCKARDKTLKQDDLLACKKCGQQFCRADYVITHFEKCTGERKAKTKCDKCSKLFTTQYYRKSNHAETCKGKNKGDNPALITNRNIKNINKQPQHNILNIPQNRLLEYDGIKHQQIIGQGIIHATRKLELEPPLQFVPGDGNCAPRAWSLAQGDPSVLSEEKWKRRSTDIRQESIWWAR